MSEKGIPAAGDNAVVVVVDKNRKKKKSKKYSRGYKDIQKVAFGAVEASDQLAAAFASGFRNYRKEADKSSRKRKDGMLIYGAQDFSKALSKSFREASKAPYDFAKSANTKTVRRFVRFAVQTAALPASIFLR